MKYSYILKPVRLGNGLINGRPVCKSENKTIEQIFQEMGQNGYRYTGYHPSVTGGNGRIDELNLVFEKLIAE